jgi:hypothetical protein
VNARPADGISALPISVAKGHKRGVEQAFRPQVAVWIQLGQGQFIEILLLSGAPEKRLRGIGGQDGERAGERNKRGFHNAASIRLPTGAKKGLTSP